ncbi:MAG: 50S ribosomal protein L6 [bacterium]
MAKNYRPLAIPAGVKVTARPEAVEVKGKLGTLVVPIPQRIEVKVEGVELSVEARAGVTRAMIGTTRAHLRNALEGVTKGFEKALQVRGMGYRVQKTKDGIQLACGFSHPVNFAVPAGLTFEVAQVPNPDDTKQQMFEIVLRGVDRHLVGHAAARLRAVKPPDPYKGKGIRYRDEVVRKKAGKRAVGAQA